MYYKDSGKVLKLISVVALVLYLLLLFRLTVFRNSMFDGDRYTQRRMTLKLWDTYSRLLRTHQPIQFRYLLLGNFFCLSPLGFACGFFRKGSSVLFAAAICLCTTLIIEFSQYIFYLGFFELDDIVLNLLGGVFGYALHLLICRTRQVQQLPQ